MSCPRVLQLSLSRENECGGLLPDCRFGVKESESEDNLSWMRWQHTWQLTFWSMGHGSYELDDRTWLLQGRLRVTENVWWQGLLQVSAWHDRSYIAGISLLAHGLTVKLSPRRHFRCISLPAQARPRMMQHLSSFKSILGNGWSNT